MNNIGYVLAGYDIYFGNPKSTEEEIDPGYRLPIFQAEYKGSASQDTRHCIPEGMSVLSCRGSCLLEFSTTRINSTKTYLKNLQNSVGVTGSWPAKWAVNGSFAASFDYRRIENTTASSQYIFTLSEASCCAYSATLYDYGHPKFHHNFIDNLKNLTDDYNPSKYFRLVDTLFLEQLKQC